MILVSNQGRCQSFVLLSPSQTEVLGGGGGGGGGGRGGGKVNIDLYKQYFTQPVVRKVK